MLDKCGIVGNNTANDANHGGVKLESLPKADILNSGISDNNQRGILITEGSYAEINNNIGDGNGTWGTYCSRSGQAFLDNAECSGSSGNHSDEGTADTAADDQAAAYT